MDLTEQKQLEKTLEYIKNNDLTDFDYIIRKQWLTIMFNRDLYNIEYTIRDKNPLFKKFLYELKIKL